MPRLVKNWRAGKHISSNGKSLAGDMSVPVNACRAGMCCYAAARIQDVNLTVVAPVVVGDERLHDRIRSHAFAQIPQALGAVKRIDERLRRDGADACGNERHAGTGCKKLCGDGNAEAAGSSIAGNDRPGHVRLSRSYRPAA